MFIVDASVTPAWCFSDETSAVADLALDRLEHDEAIAPGIWPLDVGLPWRRSTTGCGEPPWQRASRCWANGRPKSSRVGPLGDPPATPRRPPAAQPSVTAGVGGVPGSPAAA